MGAARRGTAGPDLSIAGDGGIGFPIDRSPADAAANDAPPAPLAGSPPKEAVRPGSIARNIPDTVPVPILAPAAGAPPEVASGKDAPGVRGFPAAARAISAIAWGGIRAPLPM